MIDANNEKTVVAIGSFDGVHSGHRALLGRVVDLAAQHNLKSVALTFCPHPRHVLDPQGKAPQLINTLDEKTALIKQCGISEIIVFPFDKALSKMSASDFIKNIIIEKLNAQYLVAGQDHNFGNERSGNVQDLLEFASDNSLHIEVVNLKTLDRKISSSAIRKALLCGDLALANEMLGYEYIISGTVVDGNRLGRTIGFPTANVAPPENKLLPKEGVYRVKIKIGNENKYNRLGMMYIGKRTVLKHEDTTLQIEIHIFDFEKDIYGQEITVALTHRIRDYIEFENIERLSEQLHRDKEIIQKKCMAAVSKARHCRQTKQGNERCYY